MIYVYIELKLSLYYRNPTNKDNFINQTYSNLTTQHLDSNVGNQGVIVIRSKMKKKNWMVWKFNEVTKIIIFLPSSAEVGFWHCPLLAENVFYILYTVI